MHIPTGGSKASFGGGVSIRSIFCTMTAMMRGCWPIFTRSTVALMEYQRVNQYIAKMVRIFVIYALNAGRETENLCRENDLRLCHMDHDVLMLEVES